LADRLAWERDLLGIYVSGHPLDAHQTTLAKSKLTIAEIKEAPKTGQVIILPVLIEEVRTVITKSGEKMSFLKLADKTSSLEAVVFPRLYKEHAGSILAGSCVLIKGNVSNRNGAVSLALDNLKAL
jgi:DNA polymerase-3 subunit alpha